jgi:DNA-binding NarL/FixJ family response regulator
LIGQFIEATPRRIQGKIFMRCLIVDDEPLARQGLRRQLLGREGVEVVGEADNVRTALELAESLRPDLIFLDVQLRGETGFDLLSRLVPAAPQVIFVTAYNHFAVQAFRADAVDYLLKPIRPAQLSEAIKRAQLRRSVAETSPEQGAEALRTLGLTAREAEVLFWIAQGKTNPEIALILKTSPGTVKKQAQKVLERLGVDSRLGAAMRATEVLGFSPS